ncbi:hypothetical protein D3C84_1256350 [compost metagenome]
MAMRLLYKVIGRQEPIKDAAYQYLSDWYGPHIPYHYPEVVLELVQAIKAGTDEGTFKKSIKKKYDI